MRNLKYNLIKGPKHTVGDYLQTLNNNDLKDIYSSSLFYGLTIPDLIKKMQGEMQKRKIGLQASLF